MCIQIYMYLDINYGSADHSSGEQLELIPAPLLRYVSRIPHAAPLKLQQEFSENEHTPANYPELKPSLK